jgi:hypothetical protein
MLYAPQVMLTAVELQFHTAFDGTMHAGIL